MRSIRINVSLPRDVLSEISRDIKPRKRSQFITDAIKKSLREKRAQKLAAEYEEASAETCRINRELEGAVVDGLD